MIGEFPARPFVMFAAGKQEAGSRLNPFGSLRVIEFHFSLSGLSLGSFSGPSILDPFGFTFPFRALRSSIGSSVSI